MADSTPLLPQMAAASDDREIVFNGVVDALSPASLYGRDYENCTGLVFAGFGGFFNNVDVANWTVTATGSNTNYVVAHRTTGAVTVSTATSEPGQRCDVSIPLRTDGRSLDNYLVLRQAASINDRQRAERDDVPRAHRYAVELCESNVKDCPGKRRRDGARVRHGRRRRCLHQYRDLGRFRDHAFF